jgi:hypothetical protein
VRGSLHLLDAILRTLALPRLDAGNPQASAYEPRAVPTVSTSPAPRSSNVFDMYPAAGGSHAVPRGSYASAYSASAVPPPSYAIASTSRQHQHQFHPAPRVPCGCEALTIGGVDPSAREVTPAWTNQPAWQDEWNEGEVRRECCRRLAWSSLTLIAGYTTYAAAAGHEPLDCWAIDPANVRRCCPHPPVYDDGT